jgi:predicted Zn-dependent protease
MPIVLKRRYLALLLLLPLGGVVAYQVGLFCWGSYHYHTAEQAVERRDFAEASLHLQKCLDVWPNELPVRLLAAQTARRDGRYDEALRHLRNCGQKEGSEEALDLEYRLLRMQQGNGKEVDPLLSFCEAHPNDAETPLVLEAIIEGILKDAPSPFGTPLILEKGEPPANLIRLRELVNRWLQLRSGPADQAQGLVWRSRAFALANDYPNAVADLRKALEIDPDHVDARLQMSRAVVQKSPEEAIAHLEILRRRHPENWEARFGLATARHSLGQLQEAGRLLDEMLAEKPDDVTVLLERGLVALDLDQLGEAERRFRHALKLAPDQPEINLGLSRCLHLAGRAAEAKHYQERFQQLDAEQRRRKSH